MTSRRARHERGQLTRSVDVSPSLYPAQFDAPLSVNCALLCSALLPRRGQSRTNCCVDDLSASCHNIDPSSSRIAATGNCCACEIP